MTALPRRQDPDLDMLIPALLELPNEERAAFVRAQGWSPPAIVRALKERAFVHLEAQPAQALALAEVGVQIAALSEDAATRALAERGMAQALHACGRYAEAVARYDAAIAAFVHADDALEAARSSIGKVDALMYLGRYDDAAATARMARATLLASGDDRRAARLDVNLGNVLHRLDRPAEALVTYERARTVLGRYGDDLEVALVDRNRGNVLAALNRFDEAITAYATAAGTYLARGREAQYAQTIYNEAYLHFLRGHYGHALAALTRVRPVFRHLDDWRHLALCDLDEAEVLLALNRLGEAGQLARRAAAAFNQLGMRYEAAKACTFSAVAALESEDLLSARMLLAEAEALFEQEGNRFWTASTRLLMADVDLRCGSPSSAVSHCDDALALLASLDVTTRKGRAYVLRARALRALGQPDAARADAAVACNDATTLGDRVLSYQAFHLLGQLQEEAADQNGAAASFRRAMDDVDWLRGTITRDDLRISFARDKVALYEDAVRNLLRCDRIADAFEQVERAKARALVDLLATGPTLHMHGDADDAQLAAHVEELRAALTGLYNRLHGDGTGRQRYAEGHEALLAQVRRYESEITAALATLQSCRADYVSLRSGAPAGLSQVRQCLGARDALLEYYLLGDEVVAFLVTDTAVRFYGPLARRSEIEETLKRWRFHLANFRFGPAFVRRHEVDLHATALDLLAVLHARLIAPLVADLQGRSLVIIPHGPLHHVPFHALYDGHSFMIEQHEIAHAPSATTLVLQHSDQVMGNGALIVGVSTPSLSHIAIEVAAVAACHDEPVVLLDAGATRAAFVATAAHCRCVHLATHAIFRADNPLFSAVQLADDWLTVSDIYSLQLPVELVVLSACDTGTSTVLQGDELIGLTRGFLYAGVRSLVASLWAVNDAATATLMAAFHRAVGAGAGPRGALRAAQRDAMAYHAHPYYWAPFIVCGQVDKSG